MVMSGGATFATIATLKQAGEQITGSLNGQAGDEPVTGTMVGKALTLHFRAATAQGDVAITMMGELGADGFRGKLDPSRSGRSRLDGHADEIGRDGTFLRGPLWLLVSPAVFTTKARKHEDPDVFPANEFFVSFVTSG